MYEPRKEKYYDPEYHLLVQDIIYTTYYEAEPDMLEPVQIVKPTQFKHKAVKQPIELKLVRQIVGVDRAAVNEAFSEFLTEERLNLNQMRFVNLIVDYIVANGNIDDNKVLMGEPFKSVGSITSLFKDDMGTAKQIMEVVAQIKRNSEEVV